jgi:hypothetical protein
MSVFVELHGPPTTVVISIFAGSEEERVKPISEERGRLVERH